MTYATMAKMTKLLPLPRHKRSQNARPYLLVDELVAVVDALMRMSSRPEGGQSAGDRGWILWTYRASSAPCQRGAPSQDLLDPVHRAVGASFTNTDADDAIQEGIGLRRGLESRQRSKVVAMTQPLKRHVDQRMIVCLQRDAQVQLQNAVGAEQQPVSASRQNLAAQPRTFEVASRDRHDATNAVGYRPELLPRSGGDVHGHQWSRRHGGLSLLEYLIDRVDRSARAAIARRDSDQSIQERIVRRARFEPWSGPEVVPGRIDGLASRERREHLRRAMTQAEGRHADQGPVVGLQRDAQIELEHPVGPQQRPVTSARQDRAAQPRAFEGTARDRRDDARPMRHRTELLRRRYDHLECHQPTGRHISRATATT